MPKSKAYKLAEQKMPTMMEGLQDDLDFQNQGNPNHGHHANQENQG